MGNNGYSVKRAKGKGAKGFVVERIEKATKAKKAAAPKAKKAAAPKIKKKAGKRRAKKATAPKTA